MKKFSLAIILVFCFIQNNISAQIPVVVKQWAQHVGILDSTFKTPILEDQNYACDDFYVASFTVNQATGADIMVIKYDKDGHDLWNITWTGTGNGRDQSSGICQDSLYIYVCGITFTSTANNFDYVTLKLRKSDGVILWVSTYNGTASNYDVATAITIKGDGIFVTGTSNDSASSTNFRTLRYHSGTGALEWNLAYDQAGLMDIPVGIKESHDSTVVIVGACQNSIIDWDYATIKYHVNGTALDTAITSGTSAGFDRAEAVKSDNEGNIYITGTISQTTTGYDIKTIKIRPDGNVAWQSTYNYC